MKNFTPNPRYEFLERCSEELPFRCEAEADINLVQVLAAAGLVDAALPLSIRDQYGHRYSGPATVTRITNAGRIALKKYVHSRPAGKPRSSKEKNAFDVSHGEANGAGAQKGVALKDAALVSGRGQRL